LTIPLDTLSLAVLNMSHFPTLMQYLSPGLKKAVAKQILLALVNTHTKMKDLDIVQKLLAFINPLVEGISGEDEAKDNLYEFEETQTNIAKIVHLVTCADPKLQLEAILKIKDSFSKGTINRMKFTFPSLVWALYRLGSSIIKTKGETEAEADDDVPEATPEELALRTKIFDLAYQTIEPILAAQPEMCLKLLLQGIQTMSLNGARSEEGEKMAALYMNRVMTIYQEEIADSDAKYKAITLIIGALVKTRLFSKENFVALARKITQFCAKLLKKQDQCKAVLMCAHLFSFTKDYVKMKY